MPEEATVCCPPPDRLAELLLDDVTPADRTLLEDHLGGCEGCRRVLENLATDPTDWETWGRRLKGNRVAWPTGPRPSENTIDLSRPPLIPGYEILGVLGRGGMGVVYKARQVALDRLVALKVIRSARHGDPDYCQRFRREAKIVARLQHPNIVQVYDSGESAGWTFLTLELVEGGTLAQSLHDRPLPAREAAQLVEALARAVHSAHQVGIVHRDLKPANVLLARRIDCQPVPPEEGQAGSLSYEPKVSDFGLARHGERPGVTQSGDVMGTPEYMAPEQARAAPGWSAPAVDVYGLGAILYEALIGRPPFRAETALATMRLLSDTEPVAPAQLQPNLPRDLETISLKCLRKIPADRYATALDLADDLRRFLAGEPITAQPIPVWVRAGKWCRRHPVVAFLGVLSALLLLGMLAVWIHFTANLRAKNADLDRLNTALTAESELVQAKQLELNRQQQTIDDNLLAAAIAARNYSELIRTDRQLRPTGDDPFRLRVLRETLDAHARIVGLLGDREDCRIERARAYHAMSRLSQVLGKFDKAEEYAKQAVTLGATIAPGAAESRLPLEHGAWQLDLAESLARRQQFAEAEKWHRQAITTFEAYQPKAPEHRADRDSDLASARNRLGRLFLRFQHRQLPAAERELLSAQDSIRAALVHKALSRYHSVAGQIEANVGLLCECRNDAGGAKLAYERSVAALETALAHAPDDSDYVMHLASSYRQLALWHRRQRSTKEALPVLHKALALWARLAAGHPRIPHYRYEVGMHHALIAEAHARNGREVEAATAFRDAVGHLHQAAEQAPTEWLYAHLLADVVVNSARLASKLGTPITGLPFEAAAKLLQPFAERTATRDAARKLLGELERVRKHPK